MSSPFFHDSGEIGLLGRENVRHITDIFDESKGKAGCNSKFLDIWIFRIEDIWNFKHPNIFSSLLNRFAIYYFSFTVLSRFLLFSSVSPLFLFFILNFPFLSLSPERG